MVIFQWGPHYWRKIAIFDQYLGLWSMTAGASSKVITLNGGVCVSRRWQRSASISESCLWHQAWTSFSSVDGYRPKTTEQNLNVHIGESEAEVTTNRRVRSRYCTVEANYRQTRSIAWPVCDSWATCLMFSPWRVADHPQNLTKAIFIV